MDQDKLCILVARELSKSARQQMSDIHVETVRLYIEHEVPDVG